MATKNKSTNKPGTAINQFWKDGSLKKGSLCLIFQQKTGDKTLELEINFTKASNGIQIQKYISSSTLPIFSYAKTMKRINKEEFIILKRQLDKLLSAISPSIKNTMK